MQKRKKEWRVENGVARLRMYDGSLLIVDEASIPTLDPFTLSKTSHERGSLVLASARDMAGKVIRTSLGRLLLGWRAGFIHHLDGDYLNNRVANLAKGSCSRSSQRARVVQNGVVTFSSKWGNILFDEGDGPLLSNYTMYVGRKAAGKQLCAIASPRGGTKKTTVGRVLLGATPGQVVDHINHNPLDNRRCNIRLCSQAQNMQNTRARQGCTSQFKGVYRELTAAGTVRWTARIHHGGKCVYLGMHKDPETAALAYDDAARRYHKEFACLNFPDRVPTRA